MKRVLFKTFLICLATVLAFSAVLTSCSDEGDTQTETAPTDINGIFSVFDGTDCPKIVYASSSTADISSLRAKVAFAMKSAFGVTPVMEVDTKSDADEAVPEILIGNTNRSESDYESNATANDAHYFVGVSGNKLVINGSSGYMLEKAVEYFISECMPQDKVSEFFFDAEKNHLEIISDFTDPRWKLERIPCYKGERINYSSSVYDAGSLASRYGEKDAKSSKLVAITNTNGSEFDAYLKRLSEYGFKEQSRETLDGNVYVTMERGEECVYTYFLANTFRVNVIYEVGATSATEVSTPLTETVDEGAVIYQYGLNMDPSSVENSGAVGYVNCGMFYVVKLADNSLIVIDGGSKTQMNAIGDEQAPHEEINEFLHEITGTPNGEKITIACWFLTHGHDDHASGFPEFISKHKADYDLKSVCANLPQFFSDTSISNAIKSLFTMYPNCKEIKLHTGQKLQFADVTMQVLYTHEDSVSLGGVSSAANGDFNSTSTVVKLTADGISMLVLGDATSTNESFIVDNYSDSTLKCDILQVAHHGFNSLPALYEKTEAEFAFIPQSYGYFAEPPAGAEPAHIAGINGVTQSLKSLVDDDKIFFAGNRSYTVGLAYRNGAITVVKAPDRQHGLS